MAAPLTPEEQMALAQRMGYSMPDLQSVEPPAVVAEPSGLGGQVMPAMASPYDFAPPDPIQSVEPYPDPVASYDLRTMREVDKALAEMEAYGREQSGEADIDRAMAAFDAQPGNVAPPGSQQAQQQQAVQQPVPQPAAQSRPVQQVGSRIANPMRQIAQESAQEMQAARAGADQAREEADLAAAERDAATLSVAEQQAKGLDELSAARTRYIEDERRRDAERLEAARQNQADLDGALVETRDIQKRIEGTEVKDRRTEGQRVGSALALALASVGDAIAARGGVDQDGKEMVLGIIREGVERDMQEQRDALEKDKYLLSAKQQEIQNLRSFGKDDIERDLIERDARLGMHIQELQAIKDSSMADETTAIADVAISAAQEDRARAREALLERKFENNQATSRQALLELYRQQEAQRAAASRAEANRPKLMAELLAKEQAGTLDEVEKKTLNELRKGEAEAVIKQREARSVGDQEVGPGKLNEAESKLFRSAQGTVEDRKWIESKLSSDDLPWWGVRGVSEEFVPNRLQTKDAARYLGAIEQISDVILRDKSGAVIHDSEIEREIRDAKSGDEARAKQAVSRLLQRYDARARSVGVDPLTGRVLSKEERFEIPLSNLEEVR